MKRLALIGLLALCVLELCVLELCVAGPVLAGSGPPRQGIVTNAGSNGPGLVGEGASLYAANCSSCHGPAGQGVAKPVVGAGGVEGQGPPLIGVGALAADFYLRTGYMPLANPHDQPERSRVLFSDREIHAMVAYVASLGKGPAIPTPQPGSVAAGQRLFTTNCAGCHQELARGGVVTGARVPSLTKATDRQIAEAVRIGPYLMPRFSKTSITDTQLNDLVAYVNYARHPEHPGGWAIGYLGPWPEGMIAWFVAAAVLVFMCTLFGRRIRRGESA